MYIGYRLYKLVHSKYWPIHAELDPTIMFLLKDAHKRPPAHTNANTHTKTHKCMPELREADLCSNTLLNLIPCLSKTCVYFLGAVHSPTARR